MKAILFGGEHDLEQVEVGDPAPRELCFSVPARPLLEQMDDPDAAMIPVMPVDYYRLTAVVGELAQYEYGGRSE